MALMTWIDAQKLWQKRFHSRLFTVSCKQLGTERTRIASEKAADEWWTQKQGEMEAAEEVERKRIKAEVYAKAKREIVEGKDMDEVLRELAAMFMSEERLNEIQQHAKSTVAERDFDLAAIILKREQAKSDMLALVMGEKPQEKMTIGKMVEAWKKMLELRVKTKTLSWGRLASYKVEIDKFKEWQGENKELSSITSVTLSDFHQHLMKQIAEKRFSDRFAHQSLSTTKQFISWLATDRDLIPLPKNIQSKNLRIPIPKTKIETWTDDDVKQLLAVAHPRFKLYVLLMLNCGMLAKDISDLLWSELNLEKGFIKRARSKTRAKDTPVVVYWLWPETLELLKEHAQHGKERVLLTNEGKPLLQDGRTDNIRSMYRTLCINKKLPANPLSWLRKTGASKLEEHSVYGRYAQYYLAHSPRTIAETHYVKPSEKRFRKAIFWLRKKFIDDGH